MIALLRGVNVGGRNLLRMTELKTICESIGLTEVQTVLQSGNVVCAEKKAEAKLARKLEQAIEAASGVSVQVVLRTGRELAAAIAANPFAEAAGSDPSRLGIAFFDKAPAAAAMESLRSSYRGPEPMELRGRELFVHYVDGMGKSKLTLGVLEKKLGVTATVRNWNTLVRLHELAAEVEG